MPYFNLDSDVRLYYVEQGQGQPLIFIHAAWMSSRFFQKQMAPLSERYHVIALDLRGHGQSSQVHYGHTVAIYAQDLHAFIQGKGLKDVVLAGWSMGCFVVWEYLKQFGIENIKGMVLIDESASDYKWPDWPLGFADLPTLIHLMSAVQSDRTALIGGFISMMFKESPDEAEIDWIIEEVNRVPESIASAILFDQTFQDYRPLLSSFTLPSLLCFGRDEKLVSIAAAEYLRDHLPQATLLIFENSGHCPFLEEPELFNQEVDKFIQSLG